MKIELPSFDFTNRLNRIITPKLTHEIAWLFGFIVGNFSANDTKVIQLKIASYDLLKKITKIIEQFGTSLRIVSDIDINNNNYNIKILSNQFYNYIIKYFNNEIPYFINETTYNNRMSFISGLFESKMCSINNESISLD
jgi:hypothetical protein